jgi:predicted ATPase
VQEAAQATLSNLSLKVGTIVTKALKAVLGDSYKFVLDFKIAYGKLAADMYLEKEGKRYDLRRDNGDGVVDIVALALRVAVMCLDRRHMRRLLILDEPCGAVSVNYQPVLGAMIKQLSDMLDLQVIMIASHGSNMQIPDAKVFDSNEFIEGAKL